MARRKASSDSVEATAADGSELGRSDPQDVARPRELPAPYLAKIGRDDLSVHDLDELEPTETLCGEVLAEADWEGFAVLPLDRKSCETCLRIRSRRNSEATAEAVQAVDE